MTKLKLLALGVFIATSASVAHAESNLTLGAGVGVVEHPYKDYDSDVYPIPVIAYESENFWFRGLGGGYYLWNDNADKLSIMAYWLRCTSNRATAMTISCVVWTGVKVL